MSTTALFIDLLIVGIQVASWLVLLIVTVFGFDWINLDRLKGWETVIAVLLVPVVYPIGIFIDNLADDLLNPWREKVRKRHKVAETQTVTRLLTTLKDEKLSDYFDYVRIRIRISRSSALNFTLITIMTIVFTAIRLKEVLGGGLRLVVVFEVLMGISLIALALYSWRRITGTFYKKLKQGWQMMPKPKEAGARNEQESGVQ